ncbi:NUDIX hydrolase [Gordonia shandongensis]|uniref:NUDIX hydrolase n=1 Tax=Gordonia shandongensis TaxID=376351 RepID=UPI00040914D5|nr:NUDIX hydrolase [Gordonia shandongensis]
MRGDGDGWVFDGEGRRFWGRHGAAGLLLSAPVDDGVAVLLQHRAIWSHQGGTWGLPGGARDSHESVEEAAVREAGEEAGIVAGDLSVVESIVTHDAGNGWTYTTVIARAAHPVATVRNGESAELRWVPADAVADLPLHPGLAASWPGLRTRLG